MQKKSQDNLSFYYNGKLLFPSDKFKGKLWASKINGLGFRYIFDRTFLKKNFDEQCNSYYFDAPENGFYEIYADTKDEVLNGYIEVKDNTSNPVNFSTIKLALDPRTKLNEIKD